MICFYTIFKVSFRDWTFQHFLFMQNVRRMFTPTYEFCRQNFCRTTISIAIVVVVVACVWTFLVILCIISVLRGIFILSFLPNDALDWEKKKIKCFCFINKWMMLMFDLISMDIELGKLRCSSKVIGFMWFLWTSGLDFINVQRTAFTPVAPQSVKNTVKS